jgi:outer membrane protein OmpA-like peptidoglycan-associated protein
MKSSSKILLFGLLSSLSLIILCLYLNLDKFDPIRNSESIKRAVDERVVIQKDEPTPSISPDTFPLKQIEEESSPIVPQKEFLSKEINQSQEEIKRFSSLLYQVTNGTITVDGKLPLMDDNDTLKETMMRQCNLQPCNREILFSPKQKDPEWRELAVEIITLFQEENLNNALFEIKKGTIVVDGTFGSMASKTRLDQLLLPYVRRYDINNTTLFEKPKPSNRPVILQETQAENNQSDKEIEDQNATSLKRVQERISEILKSNPINFHRNRAAITQKSKKVLKEIIEVLKDRPDLKIEVQGHTDAGGKARINLWISTQRAKSVKNYLGSHGLNPKKITAKGFGERDLLFKDEPYNILNRRVEIVIKGEN